MTVITQFSYSKPKNIWFSFEVYPDSLLDVDVYLHGLLGIDVDVPHEPAGLVLADGDGGQAERTVALGRGGIC